MNKQSKYDKERVIIEDFIKYLEDNRALDENDEVFLLYKKKIAEIVEIEIKELGQKFDLANPENEENDLILCFTDDFKDSNYIGAYNTHGDFEEGKIFPPHRIRLNKIASFNALNKQDAKQRKNFFGFIVSVVFHELQHYRQLLMSQTQVSSKNSLQYAKEEIMTQYLDRSFYDGTDSFKKSNYENVYYEADAEVVSLEQYISITGMENLNTKLQREKARKIIGVYIYDVLSKDGESHYDSKGYILREDAYKQIIDDVIGNRKQFVWLKLYPILLKEYNEDGSKKSALTLYTNMKSEIGDISENSELDAEEKGTLIEDCKAMYFELIYNQMSKMNFEQMQQLEMQIGKDGLLELFNQMQDYFNDDFKKKNEAVKILKNIREKEKKLRYRHGHKSFIRRNSQGEEEILYSDILVQMDDALLSGRIKFRNSDELMTVRGFLEKNITDICNYFPINGISKLQNGSEISIEEFIKSYVVTHTFIDNGKYGNQIFQIIWDNIRSQDEEIEIAMRQKLKDYYRERIFFIETQKRSIQQGDKNILSNNQEFQKEKSEVDAR